MTPPTTVAEALADAQRQGLVRLDAQLLALHSLGRDPQDRAWLLAHDDALLHEPEAAAFISLCERRLLGEPVAYLLGRKEFHGLMLQVDARVLVPRPETETLVDWALQLMTGQAAPRVLDLGTGSGAIALAVCHARPDAHVEAVDISADALDVARANARAFGLTVTMRQGGWLAGAEGRYGLIVSNPPYVAQGDPHLAALQHEPLAALVAGPDGLGDIRCIVQDAPSHLLPGGWLLLEHGWDQGAAVRALMMQAGLRQISTRPDLAGIERCSGGQLELG